MGFNIRGGIAEVAWVLMLSAACTDKDGEIAMETGSGSSTAGASSGVDATSTTTTSTTTGDPPRMTTEEWIEHCASVSSRAECGQMAATLEDGGAGYCEWRVWVPATVVDDACVVDEPTSEGCEAYFRSLQGGEVPPPDCGVNKVCFRAGADGGYEFTVTTNPSNYCPYQYEGVMTCTIGEGGPSTPIVYDGPPACRCGCDPDFPR